MCFLIIWLRILLDATTDIECEIRFVLFTYRLIIIGVSAPTEQVIITSDVIFESLKLKRQHQCAF